MVQMSLKTALKIMSEKRLPNSLKLNSLRRRSLKAPIILERRQRCPTGVRLRSL